MAHNLLYNFRLFQLWDAMVYMCVCMYICTYLRTHVRTYIEASVVCLFCSLSLSLSHTHTHHRIQLQSDVVSFGWRGHLQSNWIGHAGSPAQVSEHHVATTHALASGYTRTVHTYVGCTYVHACMVVMWYQVCTCKDPQRSKHLHIA